jgi:hypothetical protein
MSLIPSRAACAFLGAAAVVSMLPACSTSGPDSFMAPQASAPPEIPASIQAAEVAGRWGLAAFHKPADRVRTEAAARGQCKQPYVIGMGQSGGVIMHLADTTEPQELRLKGSPSGKNYIGPPGEAGGQQDREIISFDGRVMLMRFVDPEVATRYGTSIYVRCAPRA